MRSKVRGCNKKKQNNENVKPATHNAKTAATHNESKENHILFYLNSVQIVRLDNKFDC